MGIETLPGDSPVSLSSLQVLEPNFRTQNRVPPSNPRWNGFGNDPALRVRLRNHARTCPHAGKGARARNSGRSHAIGCYEFNLGSEAKFVESLCYTHRNPVERGLVACFESSFRHYLSGEAGVVEIESHWAARNVSNVGSFSTVRVREENPAQREA